VCRDSPNKLKGICFIDFNEPNCLINALELDGYNLRGRFLKLDADISFDETTNTKIKSRNTQHSSQNFSDNSQMLSNNLYMDPHSFDDHFHMMHNSMLNNSYMQRGAYSEGNSYHQVNENVSLNSFNSNGSYGSYNLYHHDREANSYYQQQAPPCFPMEQQQFVMETQDYQEYENVPSVFH